MSVLTGPHSPFAQRNGCAARYHPEIAGLVALEDHGDPQAWKDAAALLGPGESLALSGAERWPEGLGLRLGFALRDISTFTVLARLGQPDQVAGSAELDHAVASLKEP